MDIAALYEQHLGFLYACARKVARIYGCAELLEDLVSVGAVAFLEQVGRYDESLGASLTTFLHPHVMGAMRREAEGSLTPFRLSRRELARLNKEDALSLAQAVSLDKVDEDGNRLYDAPSAAPSVEQQVYQKICLEYLEDAFESLSYKERVILGGCFGVYGHKKEALAEIGEGFQMGENAVRAARDKALDKLRVLLEKGVPGRLRGAQAAIRSFREECELGRWDLGRYWASENCEEI